MSMRFVSCGHFFYFELVKRYKNIPLITKVVTKEEANNAEPVAAGVILDFIISECTEMAQLLPVSYTNFGTGSFQIAAVDFLLNVADQVAGQQKRVV